MENTYKLIKNVSKNFRGHAALYEVEPPIEKEEWKGEDYKTIKCRYVIVSSVNDPLMGKETFMFRSNDKGEILSWSEMLPSQRGTLEHSKIFRDIDYAPI